MVCSIPLFRISLCTSAICAETEAVGVPMGTRQKSATHFGGVAKDIVGRMEQESGCLRDFELVSRG